MLTLSLSIFSQKEEQEDFKTILGERGTNGGYGGFSFGYASIAGSDAAIFGGQGAWILNHYLSIGIAGSGFATDFKSDTTNLVGGYGGLLLEPIILPLFPVHLSLPILLGAGGIAKTKTYYYSNNSYVVDSDPFFFVRPGAEIELNLTRHMRLALGAYYMYTSRLTVLGISKTALNNFSGAVTLKFGKF